MEVVAFYLMTILEDMNCGYAKDVTISVEAKILACNKKRKQLRKMLKYKNLV